MNDSIFTPAFAAEAFTFIAPRIDLQDWGQWKRLKGNPEKGMPVMVSSPTLEGRINGHPIDRHLLNPKLLLRHLKRKQKLYYKANRNAPEVLVGLDIDAHDGEMDALTVADWARGQWFPGAYSEGSDRGYTPTFVLTWEAAPPQTFGTP